MRYSTIINNIKANEWGLTIQQAYLFSWFYELPSWANKVMIKNEIFYFASKFKAIEELSILTDKSDTMYRYYKQIESLDLIVIKKIDGKDYIALTEKGKEWNNCKSDRSENNPSLGNLSEKNSENNPTYNIYNNNINNKKIYKKNSIEERQKKFYDECAAYVGEFGKEIVREFYDYWSEENSDKTKFKKEFQKTFNIKSRLNTWKKNKYKFTPSPQIKKNENENFVENFFAKRTRA